MLKKILLLTCLTILNTANLHAEINMNAEFIFKIFEKLNRDPLINCLTATLLIALWRATKKNSSMERCRVMDAHKEQRYPGLKQNTIVIDGFKYGLLLISRQPSSQSIYKECNT